MPPITPSPSRRPKPHRYALESRQMYDGAAVVEAAHHADAGAAGHEEAPAHRPAPESHAPAARDTREEHATPTTPQRPPEGAQVYVIDQSVAHWQSLVSQLPTGSEVIVLDQHSSGLDQIATALHGRNDISALHVLSHGASDSISLGTDTLTATTAAAHAGQLGAIGASLTADGDILLYGCDVAAQDRALMTQLASLTHADIAASTNATGAADHGGDWVLETSTGAIEARTLSLDYDGLLAAPTVTTTAKTLTVAEPSSLNDAGADSATLSGWTISDDGIGADGNPDTTVTVKAVVADTAVGTLSSGSGGTVVAGGLEFTGTAAAAQTWLNQLTFTAADNELGNKAATTTIDVTVTDAQSLSATHSLNINVTPSNDPVIVADTTITVDEVGAGATTTITAGMLNALDPEVTAGTQKANQIVYTVQGLPTHGYLALNGNRLGTGSIFTQQDVIDGKLTYVHTTTSGADQDAEDGFDLRVNDGATPLADSATPHITVTVNPVNQAPSVGGAGIVYEGQPANAVGTGNVGQYITVDDGGDPGDSATLYITSLPTHGTLYYNGAALTAADLAGNGFTVADKSLLTYSHDGNDTVATDSFGVRAIDTGDADTTTDSTVTLTVRPVDDDPTFDTGSTLAATVTAAGAGGNDYAVTLTAAMIGASDVDSADERISFIAHWTGMDHGVLVLNGQQLTDGDSFTLDDIKQGRVQYVQTAGANAGDTDHFTFELVDNTTALRWDDEGHTFTRMGGDYDGAQQGAALTRRDFTLNLADTVTANTDDWSETARDLGTVSHADSSQAGNNPDGIARGTLMEGGTIVLGGTADAADTHVPYLSYVAHDAKDGKDIAPSQVVYTFLGFTDPDGGGNGGAGTLQRQASPGNWVDINDYDTFTQADLNNGNIRFQHDGDSENFHTRAQFSVSAGVRVDDGSGGAKQDVWTPTLDFYITPVNDNPTASGSSDTVIAEGDTAYITTGQLQLGDPDDAASETTLEGRATIPDGNGGTTDNYALDNDATGANALKLVIDTLPPGGKLQYLDSGVWKDVGAGQVLDASLITGSEGSTGLRFVSDGSEVRTASFNVHAMDRRGAISTTATVTINITNVNDGPTIAHNPKEADPTVTDPNQAGGAPANEPLTVIEEGGYTRITADMLQAYDPDSSAEQVQYRITGAPTHGNVAYSDDGGQTFHIISKGSSFTQQDVIDGHIYYIHNGDEPSGNTFDAAQDDTLKFTVSDGNKEQADNELWIYALPTNDPPTVAAPAGPVRIDGDSTHASGNKVSGFSIADVDLTGHDVAGNSSLTDYVQVVVRLLDKNGAPLAQADYSEVTLGYGAGATVDATHGGNHDYLVLRGTRAEVNTALAGLTVTFDTDQDKIYQVQVIADDRLRDASGVLSGNANGGSQNQAQELPGTPDDIPTDEYNWYSAAVPTTGTIIGNIAAKSVTIWASSDNDPPVVTVPTGTQTPYEDTAFTFSNSKGNGITIADAESSAFGLDVQVTLKVSNGTLNVGGSAGVTVTGSGTGTVTLTGTVDNIQTLLDSGFTYTGKLNYNGTDTLTVTLDEHDAAVGEDVGSGSVKNPNAVKTIDLDLIAVNDAPTVSMPAGPVAVAGGAAGTAITGISVGDAADFSDGIDVGETDAVQVTVRLLDSSGTPLTDYTHVVLGVDGIGATVDGTYDGNAAPLVLRGTLQEVNAALATLHVAVDGDSNATYQLQVLVDDRSRDASGALTAGANGGSLNQETNPSTVPATVFNPLTDTTATATALYNVVADTVTLYVSDTNNPPANDMPASLVLPEDSSNAAVRDASGHYIQISDSDDFGANLTVKLDVTGGTLAIGTHTGVTLTGSGTAALTLVGSKADLNAALQTLTFTATTDLQGPSGIANIHVTTTDTALAGSGGNETVESDLAIALTTVNDRPSIATNVTLPAVNEDSSPTGTRIGDLTLGYSDARDDQSAANNGAIHGIDTSTPFSYVAIVGSTGYEAGQGTWQVSDGAGGWIDIPASGLDATHALVFDVSRTIRFVPATDFHGTPGTLTVRAADGSATITTSTNAGDVKNLSTDGGTGTTGAWSNETKTIGTTVTNVNDRPTATDTTLPAIDEDVTNPAGVTVGNLGFGFSDATDDQTAITGGKDASTDFGGIAIVGNHETGSHGTWQYSTDGGASWQDIGTPSDSSAIVLDTDAKIRFKAAANYNGAPGTLDVRVSDADVTAATGVALVTGPTSQWSDTVSLDTHVNPLNDAPDLAGTTAANPEVDENTDTDSGLSVDPVNLLGTVALTDIDLGTTGGLDADTFGAGSITVKITDAGGYVAGDILFVDGSLPTGVTTSGGNGADLVITLTDTTTLAEVEGILQHIAYKSSSDNPTVSQTRTTRSYSIQVSDGNNTQDGGDAGGPAALSSQLITGTLTIAPNNDAPAVDLNGAATGTGNTVTWTEGANVASTPVSIAPAARLTDVDNANLTGMTLTVAAVPDGDAESLTIGGHEFALGTSTDSAVDVGDFLVSYDAATHTFTITPDGTTAAAKGDFESLLQGVTYNNSNDNPTQTDRTITVAVTDAGYEDGVDDHATDALGSNVATITVHMTAVNDPPIVTTSTGSAAFTENGAAIVVDGGLTLSDADDTELTGATVRISTGLLAGDALALADDVLDGTGITADYDATTGTLTLSGTATVAQYQAVLRQVTFENTGDDPTDNTTDPTRTITFTVTDANKDGAGAETGSATRNIAITATTDVPVMSAGGSLAWTEGDAAKVIDAGVQVVSDADDTEMAGATVQLTLNHLDDDVLAVAGTAIGDKVAGTNITVTGYNAASGTLTLSGTDTLANYQAVLRQVTFANTGDNPTNYDTATSRTVSWQITDANSDATGAGTSVTVTSTIDITAVNDAPVARPDTNAVNQDDTLTVTAADGVIQSGGAGTSEDTDADNQTADLHVTGVATGTLGSVAAIGNAHVGTALVGSYGTLTLNDDGSYTYVADQPAAKALGDGDTANDVFSYAISDGAGGTACTTLTITVTGTPDAPDAVNDTDDATEAGGRNNTVSGVNAAGNVLSNDAVDTGDTKTVTAIDFGGTAGTLGSGLDGAYGTLTLNADGSYTYVVDNTNTDVEALRLATDTLTDTFTYTVENGAGIASTATLTITIHGANDAPVAVDDTGTAIEAGGVANGTAGSNATGNVLGNDTDVDAGDSKTVTAIRTGTEAGTGTGGTVGEALTGAYGTLTLNDDGSYTYVVDDDNATVQALQVGDTLSETFTYTMKDTAGLTDTATLTITIEGRNDNPVANPDVGDVNEDGTTLTVNTANGVIRSGTATTGVDTDIDNTVGDLTVTGVAAGTLTDAADVGTDHVGSGLAGSHGTLTLNADGSYSYAVNNADAAVNALKTGDSITDVFTYAVSDGAGGTAVTTLTLTIHGHTDGTPAIVPEDGNGGAAGHATVHESGLVDGDDSESTTGKVTLTAADGLASVTIDGSTVTLDELEELGSDPVTIHTPDGTLVLTGFTPDTSVGGVPTAGTLDYTYTLDRNRLQPNAGSSIDIIGLTVTDAGGSHSDGTLIVNIVDDTPTAYDDVNDVTEDSGVPATGNVVTENDRVGADTTTTPVTAVSFGGTAGTLGSGLAGSYGTLTLNPDGSYSYAVDDNNAAVNALKAGDTLTDTFSYTLTDGDGDSSTATLTLTIHGHTDGPPSIVPVDGNGGADGHATVRESGLVDGDGRQSTTGQVTLTAPDGLASITVGGTTVTLTGLQDLGGHPVTIHTPDGTLVLTGFTPGTTVGGIPTAGTLDYSYTVDTRQHQPGADHSTDTIALVVTDTSGDTSNGSLVVNIVDDTPTAYDDANDVTEDSGVPATGNVVTENDRVGADTTTTPVTAVSFGGTAGTLGSGLAGSYGTLTLNPDGSYSYAVDDNNAAVNALKAGDTLTDTFSYTLTDADGDSSTATLTLTIHGHDDGTPSITPVDGNGGSTGHTTVRESGLVDGDGTQTSTGIITLDTPDGLTSITVGGTTVTLTGLEGMDPDHPVTIQTPTGTLVLTGFTPDTTVGGVPTGGTLTYTYTVHTRQHQPGADHSTDNIPLVVTDAGGGSSGGTLVVNIVDDTPTARDDVNDVTEDSGIPAIGNVVTENDRIGADTTATPVTAVGFGGAPGTVGHGLGGAYGTLTLNPDGSYSYVLDNDNAAVNALKAGDTLTDTFSYTIADADGDSSAATLTITIHGHDDGTPSIVPVDGNGGGTGHTTVRESGLVDGDGRHTTTGRVTVGAPSGLVTVTVGGTTLTVPDLDKLDPRHPVTIHTPTGTLRLTGFTPDTTVGGIPTGGTLTYTYTLDGPTDQPGADGSTDTIPLGVTDAAGGHHDGSLVVLVVDDAPQAHDDHATILQQSHQDRAEGNVFTGQGDADGADRIGADGPAKSGPVTAVTSTNLGHDGQVGGPTAGAYGTLVLNPDGSYSYVIDTRNPAVAALDINQTLTEIFTYTITDADGDTSQAQLVVTIGGQPSQVPLHGDEIFPVGYEHRDHSIDQVYGPGLFITPVVNDVRTEMRTRFGARLQGRALDDEELLHSSLLRLAQGPTEAQHVLRDGVAHSRRLLAEIRAASRVSANHHGLRQSPLWDDFSPFSLRHLAQRESDVRHPAHPHPAPHAHAPADTAHHAALAPAAKPIVLPAPGAAPAGAPSLAAQVALAGAMPLPRVIPVAPSQPPAQAHP